MSTINEALKKAQDKKDTRPLLYGSVLSAGTRKKLLIGKKSLLWLIIPALLIVLTLTSEAWLDRRKALPPPAKEIEGEQARLIESPPDGRGESVNRLYERARNFHGQGQLTLAKRFYLEVLRIDSGHANTINNLGVICLTERDFAEAERYFNRALDISPGEVDPHYNLACLYSLQGEAEQAIKNLKKAIELDQTVREWARMDSDLDGLRETSEFEALIN